MTGHILKAQPQHLDQLEDIISRVIVSMNADGIPQWDSLYPNRNNFKTDVEKGTAWIYAYARARSGEAYDPVAYMVLDEFQDEEYKAVSWKDTGGRPLVIHRLFVDPDFQGKGIARSLLLFAEEQAAQRGCTSIRLDAFTLNNRSCSLYLKSGYAIRGTVKFRKGDFYCLEKKIESADTAVRRILSVGSASVDIKAFSYEEGGTEAYRDGTIDLVPGGVARGMAINLSRLGFSAAILSVVGQDIFGDFLRKGLVKNGIDTALLRTSRKQKTALFSVMASRGSPSSCIYCNDVLNEIKADSEVYDYIVKNRIDTLVMDSNIPDDTLKRLYEIKQELSLFVFQNATAPDIARKSLPYAPLIDLFACNEFEAAAILGEKAAPDTETAAKFRELGFRSIIVTFGEQGVMVHINGETWNEKPYKPRIVLDTIGAGDAFASGFLFGFLKKKPVKRCIQYGLACAKETLSTYQTVSDYLCPDLLESYADHTISV